MAKANQKEIETDYIQLKFGLVFSKLLEENKSLQTTNKIAGIKNNKLNVSLGNISSETELRVATLSEIFSGKSNPKAVTIDKILKALGKTFFDFAKHYDSISEADVAKFKMSIDKAKTQRIKLKKER